MPKLDLQTLRWVLVVGNLCGLSTLSWCGYLFYFGDRNELHVALEEPQRFKVEVPKGNNTTDKQARDIRANLYRKPKPTIAPKTDEPKVQQPLAQQGGPLAIKYEILSISLLKGSVPMVYLGEKQAQNVRTPTPRRVTRRGSRRTSRRSPVSRRSTTATTQSANEGLMVGGELDECTIDEIHAGHILYSQGAARFELRKNPPETALEPNGVGWALIATDDEEAAAEAGKALDQIDPATLGTIGREPATPKPSPKKVEMPKKNDNSRAPRSRDANDAKRQLREREARAIEAANAKRKAREGANRDGGRDNRGGGRDN